MDLDSLWAQIEQEQSWRTDEIRFFDNHAAGLPTEDQDKFRRANILVLYSHYEGFCKFVFSLYVNAINSATLKGVDVNFSILAASLNDVFKALRNPEIKSSEFGTSSPEDKKLHIFYRDKSFLEKLNDFENQIVVIPDSIVDTESNLKPVVLRKNLYRLGFPHDGLKSVEGTIHRLLHIRNEIAHGASNRGIPVGEYQDIRNAAFDVMNAVKRYVMNSLTKSEYLRRA